MLVFFLAQKFLFCYNLLMNKTKYKYILFDLDDTLIENHENIKFAFEKVASSLGKTISEDYVNAWLDFDKQYWADFYSGKFEIPEKYKSPSSAYVAYARGLRFKLFFNTDIESGIKLNDEYIDALNEKVVAIDGAFETLEALSKNYTIVIATNGPSAAVESKLSKIGCRNFVSNYFSSDMTKHTISKPSAEYFEELLDYIDFHEKDKIIFVGNSLRKDVAGAINFGIDAVWLNLDGREKCIEINPTFEIDKLVKLKDIL